MMDPSFWVQFVTFLVAGGSGDSFCSRKKQSVVRLPLTFCWISDHQMFGVGLVIINNIAQINIARVRTQASDL